MKTIKTISKFAMIAFIALATSCSKDDVRTPVIPLLPQQNADSFITAKVDGSEFSTFIFGTSTAGCNKFGNGQGGFIVTILGATLAGDSIVVTLDNITATGTYNVNNSTDSFLAFTPNNDSSTTFTTAECESASGTIIVTVLDATHVEGTFVFTGKNNDNCSSQKVISEGVFKGTFPQ